MITVEELESYGTGTIVVEYMYGGHGELKYAWVVDEETKKLRSIEDVFGKKPRYDSCCGLLAFDTFSKYHYGAEFYITLTRMVPLLPVKKSTMKSIPVGVIVRKMAEETEVLDKVFSAPVADVFDVLDSDGVKRSRVRSELLLELLKEATEG